jgi:regulator of sigma E protease
MSVLYFIVMVGVLVFIHELGHFLAARLCKVKVKEFAVGMGPRLASFTRRGTRFMIGALPLGGYVLMANHDDDCEAEGKPLDQAPLLHRAWIALAGPLFSLLFAIPCYLAVGLGTTQLPAPAVGHIASADSPAAVAGLQVGDLITEANHQPVQYWHELRAEIARAPDALPLTVRRGDHTLSVTVEPLRSPGQPPQIGIFYMPFDGDKPQPDKALMRPVPWSARAPLALRASLTRPVEVSQHVLGALGGMITGRVSTRELGGPIMIFNVASDAGREGWTRFLELMAVISINLGLLNLLPIPILDGGKLLLIGVEAVQRRPLSMRAQQVSSMVGFSLVVGLMVLAFKNDIERYWDRFSGWLG